MNEKEMQDYLERLLLEHKEDDWYVSTYEEQFPFDNVPGTGLVVRSPAGDEFQLTIVQTVKDTGIDIKEEENHG